jgi:hypothetical protein
MAKTVMGLVDSSDKAQPVVEELVKNGIERKDIGIVSSEALRETASALAGASKGIAYGSLAGLLVGVATVALPGIGLAMVAGPAVPLLTTITGAIAGGLIGGLRKKGVPESQANFYAEGVRRGGTLIIVNARTDELASRAVDILKEHGAVDIDERAEQWRKQGWSGRFDSSAKKPQPTPGEAEPPVVLSAVEIYDFEVEAPERRTRDVPYSGEDRRYASSSR